MVDEHAEATPAEEPAPVEEAAEPAEVLAVSRFHQQMERRSAMGCALVVLVLAVVLLVWGAVAFR